MSTNSTSSASDHLKTYHHVLNIRGCNKDLLQCDYEGNDNIIILVNVYVIRCLIAW
jgi:hypothetical protein